MWQGACRWAGTFPRPTLPCRLVGPDRPSGEGARSLTPELQGRDKEGYKCWQLQPLLWNLGVPHGGP